MPFTPEIVTQQVQEKLKQLSALTHEIEDERIKSEPNYANLIKAKEKQGTGDEKRSHQVKMKSLLKEAIADTEREEKLLRKALDKITEIRTIRNECRIQVTNTTNQLKSFLIIILSFSGS